MCWVFPKQMQHFSADSKTGLTPSQANFGTLTHTETNVCLTNSSSVISPHKVVFTLNVTLTMYNNEVEAVRRRVVITVRLSILIWVLSIQKRRSLSFYSFACSCNKN